MSNRLAPAPLVWVWLLFVVVLRVGAVVMGVCLLCIRHETLRLTIAAKVSTTYICTCISIYVYVRTRIS